MLRCKCSRGVVIEKSILLFLKGMSGHGKIISQWCNRKKLMLR